MSIRPAPTRDYSAFTRLFAELETGDATPSLQSWTDELAPHTLVDERDGEVVAYLYFQVFDGLGYVRHIAVDPRRRGVGIGRALMLRVAARLREDGVERWCLNVKSDNVPALRLYESLGMALGYTTVVMRMSWTITQRLPAPGPTMQVMPLVPEDDHATEDAFGLPRGLLDNGRRKSDAHLLLAREADEIAGVAVFQAAFPGAYPFRARTPAATRALLHAMEPHAERSKSYVQLVIEDAPEIVDALAERGATRHLTIVHLRGDVPA